MKSMNRREFLKTLGLSISALALNQTLSGCTDRTSPINQQLPTIEPARQPTSSTTQQMGPVNSTNPSAPVQVPSGSPDLVVARNGEPEEMVRRAISALGGMQRFVAQGSKVSHKTQHLCGLPYIRIRCDNKSLGSWSVGEALLGGRCKSGPGT